MFLIIFFRVGCFSWLDVDVEVDKWEGGADLILANF